MYDQAENIDLGGHLSPQMANLIFLNKSWLTGQASLSKNTF